MGILNRLNRLDDRLMPGMRKPGETDEEWLRRIGQMRSFGGWWMFVRVLARVSTRQSDRIAALEARVAELERERG